MGEARRYGQWAGNPKGLPEDPIRCVEVVWSGFQRFQCSRNRGHGPDGLYCKQHNPIAVKAKADARKAAWEAKWAQKTATWADEERRKKFAGAAEIALRQIAAGHNDPRSLATETLSVLDATPTPENSHD